MKTRLFVALALLVLALSVIPASATFAASPTANAPVAHPAPHTEVVFIGTIQSLPGNAGFLGMWKVNGKAVRVNRYTQLDQTDFRVRLGATVRVEGYKNAKGNLIATSIDILS